MIRAGARALAVLLAGTLLGLAGAPAAAYEPDPVSDREGDIADSTGVLNREVNRGLEKVLRSWQGPRDDRHLVYRIWDELAGLYWVHHHEAFANQSPEVQRLPTRRYRSVYTGLPIWATRVIKVFGVCPTIRLNGVYVGTDKLGHFFSQGRKYYVRWLRSRDEAQASEQSAFTERAIFGSKTTGVYSNGDLVSNFEGYRFYRALFEDDVIPGKRAMLRWDGAAWHLQEPFDWRDYVNSYWDEGILISRYDALLYPHMKRRFSDHCESYRRTPANYSIAPELDQALMQRYAHIGLLDTRELRLDRLCAGGSRAGG